MMASVLRGLSALGLTLVIGGASSLTLGCRDESGSCESLQHGLATCGLPAREIDCSRIDRADREALADAIHYEGCPTLATDSAGNVDPRVCKLGGWECPGSPLPEATKGAKVARYPLVFVSGIDGTPTSDWNPRVLASLRDDYGIDVGIVHVLPWAPIADRAADLSASLETLMRGRGYDKVNLVCYAVAGLDCRYLVSPHGLYENDRTARARAVARVASITTIATPHRGTHVADAALEALGNGDAAAIFAAISGTGDVPASLDHGALATTLQGLTPTALNAWNERVDDAEGVVYQSIAGVSRVLGKSRGDDDALAHCVADDGKARFFHHDGTEDALGELLWVTAPFAGATIGDDGRTVTSPSDGMVSVESAKWGKFLGCVPADHYDVIGQIGHVTRDVRTGFDPVDLYRFVSSALAQGGV